MIVGSYEQEAYYILVIKHAMSHTVLKEREHWDLILVALSELAPLLRLLALSMRGLICSSRSG